MTREEAIKIFNEVLLFGKAPCTQVEFEELAKMSIKALEQEPTTKSDLGVDCISRADAIRVASGYCHPSNVAKELAKLPSVTPQMVEIDLYSVIKQKYIEREVLDKIRAEIEQLSTSTCAETRRIYIDADDFKENVLAILDKYKAESEDK